MASGLSMLQLLVIPVGPILMGGEDGYLTEISQR